MKKIVFFIIWLTFSLSCLGQQDKWAEVEKVFGKKGTVQDGVFKITFPRSDLNVQIGDFIIEPGLALTSWIGLIMKEDKTMPMKNQAMMMGDMVLLNEEVAPVLKQIFLNNLDVTAIHNHLIGESPNVKYLHFSGKGNPVKLAEAIKSVLSVTRTPMAMTTMKQVPINKQDWSKVTAILGTSGKQNGDLLQYGFPRAEKLTEDGMEIPPYIGMATGINFQMKGAEAAITGDFVLLADEVNTVAKTLTDNGIAVTALHNHMLYDNPRLFMMHFWAVNDPEKLAKALKTALDKTNTKK